MARAGYCSGCRNYVFLRPDGGCSNGHGPEYISAPYEVPDVPAQPVAPAYQQAYPAAAPVTQPAYQQPAQPVYAPPTGYAQPAVAPPKRKRTGLVIALVIIGLLLTCGCVAAGIGFGLIPNPTALLASPEHQKVAAAGDFFKSVATADLAGLTRNIPTAAAAAANPAFWTEKVLTSSDKATFNGERWNGDVLTQDFTSSDGTKRTVTYKAVTGADKVAATMAEAGDSSTEVAVFTMVKEAGGWKVLALGGEDGSEFLRFTPEAIKQLEEENK